METKRLEKEKEKKRRRRSEEEKGEEENRRRENLPAKCHMSHYHPSPIVVLHTSLKEDLVFLVTFGLVALESSPYYIP